MVVTLPKAKGKQQTRIFNPKNTKQGQIFYKYFATDSPSPRKNRQRENAAVQVGHAPQHGVGLIIGLGCA